MNFLYVISFLCVCISIYLFKNKKWTQGTWIVCFSLAVNFGGILQIPKITASIENSFNLSQKVSRIEEEIKSLKAESATIKNLTVTGKTGTVLRVFGDSLFDGSVSSIAKNGESGSLTLVDKHGKDAWRLKVEENDLVLQRFSDGGWISKYSTSNLEYKK